MPAVIQSFYAEPLTNTGEETAKSCGSSSTSTNYQSINQTSIAPISPAKPGSVARQPYHCSTAVAGLILPIITYQSLYWLHLRHIVVPKQIYTYLCFYSLGNKCVDSPSTAPVWMHPQQYIASLTFLLVSIVFMATGNHWFTVLAHCQLMAADQMRTNSTVIRPRASFVQSMALFQTRGGGVREGEDPLMTSPNSWFWCQPVRWDFQAPNSKSTNFSANATFSIWDLITIIIIIVPHYMKNFISVNCVTSLHMTIIFLGGCFPGRRCPMYV